MANIFIHPSYNPVKDKSGNTYLKHFFSSLKSKHNVCARRSELGLLSALFNLRARFYFFHWVESIPLKPFGLVQSCYFVVLLLCLKLSGKKIVFVLHNKESHATNNSFKSRIGRFLMYWSALFSNKVITHSKEGVSYFKSRYPRINGSKCIFIPHPVYNEQIYDTKYVRWDYIIWGSISRYKNVVEFMRFYNNEVFFRDKKLLICGRCKDQEYLSEIEKEIKYNIEFVNDFIEDSKLDFYIKHSKVIVFTYNLRSVLSSGALIYSLNYNKVILGPNGGAFFDLRPIVNTYENYKEIIEFPLSQSVVKTDAIKNYIESNNWGNFENKLKEFNVLA